MHKFIKIIALFLGFIFLLPTACKKDDKPAYPTAADYQSTTANSYFKLAIKLTKEGPGFTPPVAARAYGYTALALYEAVVPGMPNYRSLQGQLKDFTTGTVRNIEPNVNYNWDMVANAALAEILRLMYRNATPDNLTAINTLEATNQTTINTPAVEAEIVDRSIARGRIVANDIWEYSKTDNQELCYTTNFPASFTPPTGLGAWVPTPPAFQKALQPYWGSVRPFVEANIVNTQPSGHPDYSTVVGSAFHTEALEVYQTTTTLTDEQKVIASFWSDDPGKTGTPPGHSISILTQILEKESATLDQAAEAYAKVGMAVHDAFISCWKCKYDFSLMRPVTYIQAQIDPTWVPILPTPPFPEYTSGHSVQSGAASKVMTDLFGDNYIFTDKTHEARTDINGIPRTFASFYAFADEAAISRLYGGIHYQAAIDDGVDQGRKIGANITALAFKK
jgi:hypothetical protein